MITPILITTISYVLGIISGKFFQIPLPIIIVALVLLVLASFILLKRQQKPFYLVVFIIFILGIFAYQYSITLPANEISRFASDQYVKISGAITDEPSISGDLHKFTLKTDEVEIRGVRKEVSGRASVFTKDLKQSLNYGNKVSVYGKLSRIVSTSNPGIASFSDLMAKRNINCQIYASTKGVKILKRSTGNPIRFVSIIIKNKLLSVIQSTMQEPYSSLLGGIIFGSQASPLSDELQDNYRTAGVIHLLVVSGTQVSIIMSLSLALCGFLGLSNKLKLVVMTAANIVFTIMVGAGPSIIRAAVMSETAIFAKTFERDNDFYNSLAISVLVLLILNPLNLFDIGFQLSFLATWALFYVAPVFKAWLSGYFPELLSGLISISIAPTIITSPVILYNFGQVSFVSVLSNFLIIPWIEITVVLGFVSTLAGLISLPAAYVINNTLTLILGFLNLIVQLFAGLPFACRYFPPPSPIYILIYYVLLIKWVEMLKSKVIIRLDRLAIPCAAIALLLLCSLGSSFAQSKLLTVTFLDVGQGDSILIESPSGRTALIDGGGRAYTGKEDPAGRSIVVPFLRKHGINNLDLVVLTHPHDDHVGGLSYVLEKIKVNQVIDSGQPHTSPGFKRFLKVIEAKHIPYKIGRAGQILDLGGGVIGYILHPSEPLIEGTVSDLNNNSIVIKLVYGKTSFLLVGDIAFEGEERLISKFNLKSDVLKVGHHGSKTSTSDGFLGAAKPRYGVISVGARNKFGHPNPKTLGRLDGAGVNVFRTDLKGAVIIKSDGQNIYY